MRPRGGARGAAAVVLGVALAPLGALVAAACVDRGPDGSVRPALFPAALAALDPWVWDGARNSLVMAVAVTAAARVVGVGAARLATRRRFWGRRPLGALACVGLAAPPAFAAIGLRGVLPGFMAGLAGPAVWERVGVGPELAAAWLAWFWATLAWSAPLVGLSAASALGRVETAWVDAARLAGAGPRRAWRQLVWPAVRPDVARALGAVFTLALLEPGAPLVLGLRRTLGHQIAQAALSAADPGQLSRAAVLALGGMALAAAGRLLIDGWGGAKVRPDGVRSVSLNPMQAVPFGPAVGSVMLLGALALLAVSPLAATAWRASGFRVTDYDSTLRRIVLNSAALGLAVLAVDLLLARVSSSLTGRLGGLVAWADLATPLAVGVGVIALPDVLAMAAEACSRSALGPALTRPVVVALLRLAEIVSPAGTPGVAVVIGAALVRLPLAARAAAEGRSGVRPGLVDAAVVLGASEGRARARLAGGWLGVPAGPAVLTWAFATTCLTPAFLLEPTNRTAGPAVIALAARADGACLAAALATAAVALNLVGLVAAARGRFGGGAVRPAA